MKIEVTKLNNNSFIKLDNNGFIVEFCDLGASIYSIRYKDDYLSHTPINKEEFFDSSDYHGKTIGRTSNRIKGNKIAVESTTYTLLNNEGDNTLHGGKEGLSNKTFNYEIIENSDATKVIFTYLSKHLEGGYPGNVNIKIIYTLIKDKTDLLVEFEAISDMTTPLSLTNHTYFTLAEPNLNTLSLQIKANKYLATSSLDLTPIEVRDIPNYLDFNNLKPIMEDVDHKELISHKAKGYDHNYYLSNKESESGIYLTGERYELNIFTNFKCVQIYTSNYEYSPLCYQSKNTLRCSIAIEPQDDFLNLNIIYKNNLYKRFIYYSFKLKQ